MKRFLFVSWFACDCQWNSINPQRTPSFRGACDHWTWSSNLKKNLVILENKTNSLKTLYFGNTGFREVSLDYISLFYFVTRFLRFVSPFCYPYFERHFFARTQTCIWVLYVNVNKNPPNPATSLKKRSTGNEPNAFQTRRMQMHSS